MHLNIQVETANFDEADWVQQESALNHSILGMPLAICIIFLIPVKSVVVYQMKLPQVGLNPWHNMPNALSLSTSFYVFIELSQNNHVIHPQCAMLSFYCFSLLLSILLSNHSNSLKAGYLWISVCMLDHVLVCMQTGHVELWIAMT